MNRSEAARIGGMDRQTLRDWVHRFNEYGPEGPIDIKPPGRPSKLSETQQEVLKQLVESGLDPATDGVVRWRCIDLKRVLGQRFGVDLSEVSLGRVLKKLGFSHISARPQHPVQNPEAIAAFKNISNAGRADRKHARPGDADRSVVPGRNASCWRSGSPSGGGRRAIRAAISPSSLATACNASFQRRSSSPATSRFAGSTASYCRRACAAS
jgi:transposase